MLPVINRKQCRVINKRSNKNILSFFSFNSGLHVVRRLVWAIFLMGTLGVCVYQCTRVITEYQKYAKTISIDVSIKIRTIYIFIEMSSNLFNESKIFCSHSSVFQPFFSYFGKIFYKLERNRTKFTD